MNLDELIATWKDALDTGGRLAHMPGRQAAHVMLQEAIYARGTHSSPNPRDPRLSRQCRKIVELLRERGAAGVTNSELSSIALKYTGRISEIRAFGFEIETVALTGGHFRYTLLSAPDDAETVTFDPRQLPLFAPVAPT